MIILETTLEALAFMRKSQFQGSAFGALESVNERKFAKVEIFNETIILDIERMAKWARIAGKGIEINLTFDTEFVTLQQGFSEARFCIQKYGCADEAIKLSFNRKDESLNLDSIPDRKTLQDQKRILAAKNRLDNQKNAVRLSRLALGQAQENYRLASLHNQTNLAWISSHSKPEAIALVQTMRVIRKMLKTIRQEFKNPIVNAKVDTAAQFSFITVETMASYIEKYNIAVKTAGWRDDWQNLKRKSAAFYKELGRRNRMVENHFAGLGLFVENCYKASLGEDHENTFLMADNLNKYKWSERFNIIRKRIKKFNREEINLQSAINDAENKLRIEAEKLAPMMEPASQPEIKTEQPETVNQPELKVIFRFIPGAQIEKARRKAKVRNGFSQMNQSDLLKTYQVLHPTIKNRALKQAMAA